MKKNAKSEGVPLSSDGCGKAVSPNEEKTLFEKLDLVAIRTWDAGLQDFLQ